MSTTTKQVAVLCESVITNTEKPLLGTKWQEAERAMGKAVTAREVTLTLVLIIWCEGWAVSPTQSVIRAILAKVTSWGLRKKIKSSTGHLDMDVYRCLRVLAKMATSLTWWPCPLPLAGVGRRTNIKNQLTCVRNLPRHHLPLVLSNW